MGSLFNNNKGRDSFNRLNTLMGSISPNTNKQNIHQVKIVREATNKSGVRFCLIEKNGLYFIKKANKEQALLIEDFEFINGKNTSRYSAKNYKAALKMFNLYTLEMDNYTLLKESKFVLKQPAPTQNVDDFGGDDDLGSDMDEDPQDFEDGGEDIDFEDGGEEDELTPKKKIQKLTGQLGYTMRQFEGDDVGVDEEGTDYSDTVKGTVKSIFAAIDVNKMEEADLEDMHSKIDELKNGEDSDESEEVLKIREIAVLKKILMMTTLKLKKLLK